jgi:Protein of unknown function with PCYCGC motif
MESVGSTGVNVVRLSLVLAALGLMVANCGGAAPSPPPAAAAAPPVFQPRAGFDGRLPPLPVVRFASARPAPLTQAAYAFAARHPDVLRHIPCFCGCERNGHGHNEDCFISRRNADGSPEWNPHGIGCGICIDVAVAAMQMHSNGTSVADIRRAIDQKYKSEYPTSTPTPHPH